MTTHNPDPVDVDPLADLDQHPDDLPNDWLDPGWQQRAYTDDYVTGPISTRGRVDQALATARHHIINALVIAGFTADDARNFTHADKALARIEQVGTDLWEYRRFGIRPTRAADWARHDIPPPIARVYTDACRSPDFAASLGAFARAEFAMPAIFHADRARLVLICLDYGISRKRAALYVHAGVAHHEVPEYEVRRRSGEDVNAQLVTLAALRASEN